MDIRKVLLNSLSQNEGKAMIVPYYVGKWLMGIKSDSDKEIIDSDEVILLASEVLNGRETNVA